MLPRGFDFSGFWSFACSFRTTSGMLFMVCGNAIWDGVVFGEGTPRTWSHRSSFNHRTGQFSADPDPAKLGELIHIVVVYAGDNSIAMYRNGKMYGKPIIPTGEAG